MKIDKNTFIAIFQSSFWKKLNDSIVPQSDSVEKEEFLEELFKEINSFSYSPSHPRDYIVYNKHNGISRYVPTFNRKDYCVYFLCIKLLEEQIAINRVDGTYGGWRLGNAIRLKEEQEILEMESATSYPFNELAWANEWRTFQGVAKGHYETDNYSYFLKLDIANFYDTINLSILERKIRHIIPKIKQEVVTLLMHFLHNWNKKHEGYNLKTVGIPQDEMSDCSRILANFYLQDYDLQMKEICDSEDAKFIRFADDQVIFAKSKESAQKILFKASKELFKINLNLNSNKVKEFESKEEFEKYWAFEIFENLTNTNDTTKISIGLGQFFDYLNNNVDFREASVLKRIPT